MGFKGCNPELVPFTRGVLVSVGGVHGLQSWAGTLYGDGVCGTWWVSSGVRGGRGQWVLVEFNGCNPGLVPFMESVLVGSGGVQDVQILCWHS